LRVVGYGLRVAGCGLRVASCGFMGMGQSAWGMAHRVERFVAGISVF